MTNFFQRYVAHNWGLKLVSLGLAVGMWLAVARDPTAEIAVTVPIELHNIPANLEVSSDDVPQVQIRLRGPERIVHRLRPTDIYAEIGLDGLKPGARTYDLTSRQIHHPMELEVVQILPGQVHLTFDTRLTRSIPVHPRVVGSFVNGYQIGQIVVEPSSILVTGPQHRVEAIDAAITDPVDISGAMTRVTFTRHPYVADPLIQVASSDPVHITVIMEKPTNGAQPSAPAQP